MASGVIEFHYLIFLLHLKNGRKALLSASALSVVSREVIKSLIGSVIQQFAYVNEVVVCIPPAANKAFYSFIFGSSFK